jgi:hypothetical protein
VPESLEFSSVFCLGLTLGGGRLSYSASTLTAFFQQIRTLGLMGRTERQREIARRRKRKTGLAKVRARYAASKNEAEKAELLAKARRMSPFIELE